MAYSISKDIWYRINAERFSMLLRTNNLPYSGVKKIDLIRRIEKAINGELGQDHNLTVDAVDRFLANEISHGRNRYLFVSSFHQSSVTQLKSLDFIKACLENQGINNVNFNNLRELSQPTRLTLAYLYTNETNNIVSSICMCFAKCAMNEEDDTETIEDLEVGKDTTDYVWVEIHPEARKLIIKMWHGQGTFFETDSTVKELYDEISVLVRETFVLAPRSMLEAKHTLYKMVKDLTETAEKPFFDQVNPQLPQIESFVSQLSHQLGLQSKYPVDLPYRIFRLFERALIQKDFDRYKAFFEGKRGYIERIAFSDQTGAYVNARSGQGTAGIEVADIYFDTRETLEELKHVDKVWVTWFYKPSIDTNVENIRTKIEVFSQHYIIHFPREYITKEVEDFVFSSFDHYEMLQS